MEDHTDETLALLFRDIGSSVSLGEPGELSGLLGVEGWDWSLLVLSGVGLLRSCLITSFGAR